MTGAARVVPRLLPRGVEVLERRARALAAGGAGERADEVRTREVVTFSLRGTACAVDASLLERAVLRLVAVAPVPLAEGGERAVALVDERPVPIFDLAGYAAGTSRPAADLVGKPALVLAGARGQGQAALAVDGPLDLADEAFAAAAGDQVGHRIPIAGRLERGASLLASAWILAWVQQRATP